MNATRESEAETEVLPEIEAASGRDPVTTVATEEAPEDERATRTSPVMLAATAEDPAEENDVGAAASVEAETTVAPSNSIPGRTMGEPLLSVMMAPLLSQRYPSYSRMNFGTLAESVAEPAIATDTGAEAVRVTEAVEDPDTETTDRRSTATGIVREAAPDDAAETRTEA